MFDPVVAPQPISRHNNNVTRAWLAFRDSAPRIARTLTVFGIALGGLVASSCAASDSAESDSAGPTPFGGQTGGLIPSCGPVHGTDEVVTVVGEQGVIVTGKTTFSATDGGTAPLDWTLSDQDGNRYDLVLEPLGDLALVQPEDPLAAGDYSLQYACEGVSQSRTFTVRDPVPVPNSFFTSVESSYDPSDYTCYSIESKATLAVELASDAKAFTDQAQVIGRAQGVEVVLKAWGNLPNNADNAELIVPICSEHRFEDCFPRGDLDLQISVEIAGQEEQPEPFSFPLDTGCQDDPPSTQQEDSSGPCSLSLPRTTSSGRSTWLWAWTALILLSWRRRRVNSSR